MTAHLFFPTMMMFGEKPPSFTYIGNSTSNTTGTIQTVSDVDFGAPDPTRVLIIALGGGTSGRDLVSVTVNSTPATIYGHFRGSSATSAIVVAEVPNDSSGPVVAQWSGSQSSVSLSVYRATNLSSSVPVDVVTHSGNSGTLTLDTLERGFAVVSRATGSAGTPNISGTGVVTDHQSTSPISVCAGSFSNTPDGTTSISFATPGNPGSRATSSASFR